MYQGLTICLINITPIGLHYILMGLGSGHRFKFLLYYILSVTESFHLLKCLRWHTMTCVEFPSFLGSATRKYICEKVQAADRTVNNP